MKTFAGCRGLAAFLVTLAAAVGPVHAAEDFPNRPVTLVVPWAAGGGSDILMRMLAETASGPLGQPIIVMNRPGAGGSIGLREVARSKSDGYTLGMMASGFIAEQYGSPNAPKLNEFVPVMFTGNDPAVIAAGAASGFTSIEDLAKAAKAEPMKILNANDQPGGTGHVAVVLIENAVGMKLRKVPYAGSAPVVQAILAGEVQTATPALVDLLEHHRAGRVKMLAVTASERLSVAPDVPTLTELGYPVVWGTIRAIFAPAGTPPAVVEKLETAFLEAVKSKEFLARTEKAGFNISPPWQRGYAHLPAKDG